MLEFVTGDAETDRKDEARLQENLKVWKEISKVLGKGAEEEVDEECEGAEAVRKERKFKAVWKGKKVPREEPKKKNGNGKVEGSLDALPEEKTDEKAVKSKLKPKKTRMRLRRGITMDSGAANNVMPRRIVKGRAAIRPSPGSRKNMHYVAANSGRIPNEGEVDFEFTTTEGHEESMVFQIAEVNKALGSISYLVDHGYKVIFDKDEITGKDMSMMMHKATKRIARFRRDKNVWILDALVAKAEDEDPDAGFHRQG